MQKRKAKNILAIKIFKNNKTDNKFYYSESPDELVKRSCSTWFFERYFGLPLLSYRIHKRCATL